MRDLSRQSSGSISPLPNPPPQGGREGWGYKCDRYEWRCKKMKLIIKEIESKQLKKNIPNFKVGDTVRVSVKVIEGEKERIQDFEGVCIRRKGSGINESFTLRRVSYGVGMERTFPIHSPKIADINVATKGRVRRAKLYYLRDKRGKAARIKEEKWIEKELSHEMTTQAAGQAGNSKPDGTKE